MGNVKRGNRGINRQKIRLLSALLLVLLGLILRFFSIPGMQFSCYLLCGVAVLLLLWSGIDKMGRKKARLAHGLKGVLTLCILAGLAAFLTAECFVLSGARTELQKPADCILILGAGVDGTVPSLTLQKRLDAALAYLEVHPEVPVVVSGGQGRNEALSEAAVMAQYLQDHGIPETQIYLEDQARNTEENIAYSKARMKEEHLPHETVGVVSSEFHLYRAKKIAQSQGMQAIGIAAQTPYVILRVNYFVREAFALLKQAAFSPIS
jgi:uncharacterized SAM-binding protein YcdF (DUF218 family)